MTTGGVARPQPKGRSAADEPKATRRAKKPGSLASFERVLPGNDDLHALWVQAMRDCGAVLPR